RHRHADRGSGVVALGSDVGDRRSRRHAARDVAEGAHLGTPAHVPVGRLLRQDAVESGDVTETSTGTLYVVSTPIGNMGDFSFRAVEVLKAVALVLAEDTRHSRPLLHRYEIRTPTSSYHE